MREKKKKQAENLTSLNKTILFIPFLASLFLTLIFSTFLLKLAGPSVK